MEPWRMDRNGMKLWPYGVQLAITPLALVTGGDLKIKNVGYIAHVHSCIHNIDAQGSENRQRSLYPRSLGRGRVDKPCDLYMPGWHSYF